MKEERKKPPHPPHPDHEPYDVWLLTNKFTVFLIHKTEMIMATSLHVDQIDTQTILATDAKGNPVTVTWDSPPVWINSNPAAATNVVSSDGTSNVLTPVSTGIGLSTTVGVAAMLGGVPFSASTTYTIIAGTVAQIAIVDTFSPAP
jgi:hypothetical protein